MNRYLFGVYVERDLEAIRDYIARDSPAAARRMMLRLADAFRLLARRPELGHTRDDLIASSPVRFWPVDSYLIAYLPGPPSIKIVAVIHGAQDVPVLMNRRALQQ